MVLGRPSIHIRRFGELDERFVAWVKKSLLDCYEKFKETVPELVEVYLFQKEGQVRTFLREEKARLGVATSLDESFVTTHDAWTGIPRISICEEALINLPYKVRLGALHHEAGHSILHGSIEFYIVPPQFDLKETYIPSNLWQDVVFLASVAVKDYQVTKVLYEKSFVDDQFEFTTYFLKPSEEEKFTWSLASMSRHLKVVFLTSLMKSVACALPLVEDKRVGTKVKESISSYIEYLPEEDKMVLTKFLEPFKGLSGRFHEDLAIILKRISQNL